MKEELTGLELAKQRAKEKWDAIPEETKEFHRKRRETVLNIIKEEETQPYLIDEKKEYYSLEQNAMIKIETPKGRVVCVLPLHETKEKNKSVFYYPLKMDSEEIIFEKTKKLQGMPFIKMVGKNRNKPVLARSVRKNGKVQTEYVGCGPPNTAYFRWFDNTGNRKIKEFVEEDLNKNRADLFKFFAEELLLNWDMIKHEKLSNYEAFLYMYEKLKGNSILPKEYENENKFNKKLSSFLKNKD